MGPPLPRAPIVPSQLPWRPGPHCHCPSHRCPHCLPWLHLGPAKENEYGFLSGTEGLGRVEEAEVEEGLAGGPQHGLIFSFFSDLFIWLCRVLVQRRQWQPTPVLLPGKCHGRRSLVGCSPWVHKESDTTERLHFHFSLSCIGEGNGNPLQCSCLENPRDRGAWWAAIYGVAESDPTEVT